MEESGAATVTEDEIVSIITTGKQIDWRGKKKPKKTVQTTADTQPVQARKRGQKAPVERMGMVGTTLKKPGVFRQEQETLESIRNEMLKQAKAIKAPRQEDVTAPLPEDAPVEPPPERRIFTPEEIKAIMTGDARITELEEQMRPLKAEERQLNMHMNDPATTPEQREAIWQRLGELQVEMGPAIREKEFIQQAQERTEEFNQELEIARAEDLRKKEMLAKELDVEAQITKDRAAIEEARLRPPETREEEFERETKEEVEKKRRVAEVQDIFRQKEEKRAIKRAKDKENREWADKKAFEAYKNTLKVDVDTKIKAEREFEKYANYLWTLPTEAQLEWREKEARLDETISRTRKDYNKAYGDLQEFPDDDEAASKLDATEKKLEELSTKKLNLAKKEPRRMPFSSFKDKLRQEYDKAPKEPVMGPSEDDIRARIKAKRPELTEEQVDTLMEKYRAETSKQGA